MKKAKFKNIHRVYLLSTLFGLALVSCASGPERMEPGTRLDIPDSGPQLGELEEQARGFIVDLTDIIDNTEADPQSKVDQVSRYLEENRPEMERVFREIETRVEQMSPRDRAFYEDQFAEYVGPATRQWFDSLNQFRQTNPTEAGLIDGLMVYFD